MVARETAACSYSRCRLRTNWWPGDLSLSETPGALAARSRRRPTRPRGDAEDGKSSLLLPERQHSPWRERNLRHVHAERVRDSIRDRRRCADDRWFGQPFCARVIRHRVGCVDEECVDLGNVADRRDLVIVHRRIERQPTPLCGGPPPTTRLP